jgi:UDP-hydrolysing UDP-N-acetyl-D-glucosamine 2-epimerase
MIEKTCENRGAGNGKRRVCVITGSRADYGLLAPLMRVIRDDPLFDLQVIVTGSHLSPRFGMTVHDIESDGFVPGILVPVPLDDDSALGTLGAMAAVLSRTAAALNVLDPEVVVLLGDRFEILAAAQAAFVSGCVVAHVHGGEVTLGAMDDAFRHAITKLSHLHFVSAEPYRERVIRMGEEPDRVFNVSALALDVIAQTPVISRSDLLREIGAPLGDGYLLVTYHPVTLDETAGVTGLRALLTALDAFPDYGVLITGPNADPNHGSIGALLGEYAASQPGRIHLRTSLGSTRYINAMRHAAAVVGNSSSGILEAPAVGVPSVNVGSRQAGRLRAPSVFDCTDSPDAITSCVQHALTYTGQYHIDYPYGTVGAAGRILDILRRIDLASLSRPSPGTWNRC